jgi:CHAD domain-containing protein
MTTDRTSIRSRLAIRGRPHRPPWGARKAGHDSILAPLAATVAATVAVGVGLAFARSERERRRGRQQQLERQLALWPGESLAAGLRRMALAQADLAIELLEDGCAQRGATRRHSAAGRDGSAAIHSGPPDEHAVHETRKALKRLRALLRLLAHELGEDTYARESATLREIAGKLAGARDAAVMLSTLDELIQRHPRKLGSRRSVLELRRRLRAEHKRTQQLVLSDPADYAAVLGALLAFRRRVAAWSLPERAEIRLVDADLERIYRQGRARHRRVARGKSDRTTATHEWRKRVKDLRYAAEMLDRRSRGGGRAPDARLRKLARRADELGELLGEDHDLAVFAERLRAGARHDQHDAWRTGQGARKQLLALIAERRRALRKRALRQGKRLYAEQPRRFTRGVRAAHAASARRLS